MLPPPPIVAHLISRDYWQHEPARYRYSPPPTIAAIRAAERAARADARRILGFAVQHAPPGDVGKSWLINTLRAPNPQYGLRPGLLSVRQSARLVDDDTPISSPR